MLQAAAEAAERAVLGCQPYDLPADKYDYWKGVDVTVKAHHFTRVHLMCDSGIR